MPTTKTSPDWCAWLEKIKKFPETENAQIQTNDRRPHVSVTIAGREFAALIDTGAVVTLIGTAVARHLEQSGIMSVSTPTVVRLANGSCSKSDQSYRFKGSIQGRDEEFYTLYLPTLTSDVVLGIDTLERLDLVTYNVALETSRTHVAGEIVELSAVSDLTEGQKKRLGEFLKAELPLFESVSGRTELIQHEIRLKKGVTPIKQRYYPRNPAMQEVINAEVDRMLSDGVIEASTSGWSSPVVLIKKPSGKYRFCIDFRRLNDCSEKDAYPLPRISAILEKLRKARFISTLDLANGYWQVPLAAASRPLTAFTVPGRGLYQFTSMPFGLHSAGATFQRLLDKVVGPELEPRAFAYLDDLVMISETFEEHLDLLCEVLGRLRKAGLKLNVEKCQFCRTELKYLGHVVNANGIGTDPEKVKAIAEFPRPTNVKSLRSFLGLASWYRRFIDQFARLTTPLTCLLKKSTKWSWTESQEEAFLGLKQKLTTTPILACPDFGKPFVLQVDASDDGLGAALTQKKDGKENVIGYASRLLSDSERKFTVTEKECLALVWAVRKFRPYIEGYHFIAVTDHIALKWLLRLKEPTGRLARWVLELQQHDFEVQYRKGVANRVADALSRHPVGVAEDTSIETAVCPLQLDGGPDAGDGPERPSNQSDKWYEKLWDKMSVNPGMNDKYVIREGKLYRSICRQTSEGDGREQIWKMCVPKDERAVVMREVHDSPAAGHFGVKKTARKVSEQYYWPGWRRDVRKYVRNCPVCQRYKVEQTKPAGQMHFRPPGGPWHTVSADLLGPLPRSKKGNRFVVAFQDQYSKWTELAPLKDATASQVVLKFKELVLYRFGAPDVLITDNGTQFTSKIIKDMAKEWDIEFQTTAPYSPQSNPIERRNRVLKTLIAQSVKGDHQTWDANLKEIAFAVNTACHESTKCTPAMLCYGRELRLPAALRGPLFVASRRGEPPTPADIHMERMDRFRRLYDTTQKNLKAAFEQQARSYNLRRRDVRYEIGQQVLKRTHVLSSAVDAIASKLAPKFDGPFVVSKRRGYNLYVIKDVATGKTTVAHVKDLKPFHSDDK